MRKFTLALLAGSICLCSCQPALEEEQPAPRQPAVLDYTMLGIWPNRMQVYGISSALGEAGIRCQLSGQQPCILNVETAKLGQAMDIVAANPAWQQNRIR